MNDQTLFLHFFSRYKRVTLWLRLLAVVWSVFAMAAAQAGTITAAGVFTPADVARTSMDIGGVWNGTSVISPTNGDTIQFTLTNAGTSSFDVKPNITIPTGMTVVTSGANVPSLTSSGCGASAPTLSSSSLSGGVLTYTLASTGVPGSGYDMQAGCAITLQFKVIASLTASTGTNSFTLNWSQASVDNGAVDPAPTPVLQSVQVNTGASTLDKLPTNQVRAVGTTAQWLTASSEGVTVTNTGIGGLFNVTINESAINPGGSLALSSLVSTTSGASCASGVCTLPYLATGANFKASVQATVTGCTAIGNTVTTTDLTGATSKSRFAQVTLDLPAPNVSLTVPNVTLNYSGTTPVSVTVANALAAGTATGLTLQTNFNSMGLTVSGVAAGWTYASGTGVFTYTGTGGNLAGNTTLNLTFDVAATSVCTGLPSGLGVWTAKYSNSCGNAFAVPTVTHTVSPPSVTPSIALSKTASASRVVVTEASSYLISLNATNTALISGTNLVVTDTLPTGVSGVGLVASAGSFTCSGACTGGSLVTWTVPKASVPATLTVNFNAPSGVCTAGSTLNNTASIAATSVQSCSLNTSSTASQLLTNNPGGLFQQDYNVSSPTGAYFEAGVGDTNNNGLRDGVEGEFVTATANYSWGVGFAGAFAGTPNSTYQENFSGAATAQLVSNYGVKVRLANTSGGALGSLIAVPNASITCTSGTVAANNCQGGFSVDLSFLAGVGFYNDNNAADKRLQLTYQMTFPDAAVPVGGTTSRTTLATLTVAGSTAGCSGTTYTQGDFVPLARARADVAVSVPQTLDVCQPFTASATVSNRNEELISNMQLSVLNSSTLYQIPSSPAQTASGFFSTSGAWSYNAGSNPTWTLPTGVKMSSAGTVSFPAFLGPTATTTPSALTARADYDDLETSATASPDFSGVNGTTGSSVPNLVRKALLKATVSPQDMTVASNKTQWLVYVTNTGNGVAYNTTVTQNLPSGLTLNVVDTNAANTPVVAASSGGGLVATFAVGTLQPGQQVALTLVADVSGATCSITGGTPISSVWGCGTPFTAAQTLSSALPNFIIPTGQLQVSTDSSGSNCPLCGTARHVVRVRNTGQASVYNNVITEISSPSTTGLVLSAVEFSTNGGVSYSPIAGAFSGTGESGSPYTVNSTNVAALAELVPLTQTGSGKIAEVLIRFNFNTSDVTNATSHSVTTAAAANTACGAVVNSGNSVFILGVTRPNITVTKLGVNRTVTGGAATTGTYISPVYAGATDNVEWKVTVTNSGPVAALNVRLTDLFAGSGATSMQLCNLSGGCSDNYASATTVSSNVALTLPSLAAGATRVLYLKEVVGTTCLPASPVALNTAKITWGCTATSTLATPTNNTGTAQLVTGPAFTGATVTTTTQNNGRAMVTYTVTNSGGSVSNAVITATIPSWAVLDQTYTTPANATYSVSGPTPTSVTGLTKGGTASTPTWTVNGTFRNGQTLTLVYYVLPTNNAGAPFNDLTAASIYPALTVAETSPTLDPVLPSSQTLTMDIAAGATCPASATASTSLALLMPDLDISLQSTGQPARLISTTTIGSSQSFIFRVTNTNSGAVNSIADNFTFLLPLSGTAWGFTSVSTATASGASLTSFSCAPSGGDQLCTFAGSIPRSGYITLTVNLTLQSLVLPMEFQPVVRGRILAQDGSTWGEHSFDRSAYQVIGAVITKALAASGVITTDSGSTGSNLTIGEEARFINTLNVFGAGANTVSGIRIRDNLSLVGTADDVLGYVSHTVTSGTTTSVTTPGAVNHGVTELGFSNITSGSAVMSFDLVARALNVSGLGATTTATNNLGAQFVYQGRTFMTNDADDTFATVGGSTTTAALHAQVAMILVKPQPTLVKQARNRTQNGVWSSAINANAGDVVEFRITVTNPTLAGGVPMRNLAITDVLDANFAPIPLATDGLDNDGNAGGTEGSISGQTVTISDATADNPLLASLPAGSSVTVTFAATSNVGVSGGTVITNTANLTWSSLPSTDATNYSGVQTASPGAPGALSGEFVATLSATAQVNFTRLGGRVYIDDNHNASPDSGETLGTPYSSSPSSGPQLYAKLTRNGVFYQEVLVSAAGNFAFGTLPADPNWRVFITTVSGAAALTPQLPPGYLGTQNAAFYVDFQIGTDGTLMPPFNFGIFRGSRLDGQVIRDNGASGGTAHDGVLNGGESSLSGVTVCASTLTSCTGAAADTTVTDGGGRFTLYVPAATLASVVNVVENNLTGDLSVSGAPGSIPGASYVLASDRLVVPANAMAAGSSYTNLLFGDVQANAFSPNQTRQALPSTQVLMPHTFVAQTTGNVTFSIASAVSSPAGVAFTDAIYRDLNCNGALDAGDDVITAPIAVRAPNANTAPGLTNPALATPSKVCILIRQFVPAEAGQGSTRTLTPRALFSYGGSIADQTLTVQDLTTVSAGATGLELIKAVDQAQASVGATLTYTLTFVNHSAKPITNLSINDATPPYTSFRSAAWSGSPASLGTCTKTTPVALGGVLCSVTTGENPVGGPFTGSIRWGFTGTLNPGETGIVTFQVRIEP